MSGGKKKGAGGAVLVHVKLLREALKAATSVVASRNTVPILDNVLLEVEGVQLRIRATDLDLEIDRHVALEEPGTLATTVSARRLSDIVGKLPADATATLALDDGKLVVTAGRARFTLPTLPFEEFPHLSAGEWDSQFELEAFDLAKLLDMLRFAICTEEVRYYLNGIFFHPSTSSGGAASTSSGGAEEKRILRAAATDGHRLARYELPLPDGAETLPDVIVPRKALGIVGKLLDKVEGKVEIAASATKIRFAIGDGETVLTAKLIDGTFPDYSRVIPSGNDKVLRISRAELAGAVERVATISTEKTRGVKLDCAKDVATLTVVSPEHGMAVEDVPGDYDSEALTIGFNARYLLDVLAQIKGDTAVVELADAAAPTIFRDPDFGQALFVLMPMRV